MDREQLGRLLPMVGIAAILMVFWNNPLVWPLKILVVFFHEMGHAIAALLTGGEVVSIGLSPNTEGVTYTRGGIRLIVLNAGYLGSLVSGIALLAAARTPKGARIAVGGLAVVLGVATLLWIRPLLSFGFAFSLLTTGLVGLLARKGGPEVVQLSLRTLGVFSVLFALWDMRAIVTSSVVGRSDAVMLAELTYIPAPVWGVVWLGLGVAALWSTRHWW